MAGAEVTTPEEEAAALEIARLRRIYRETLAVEAEYLDALREAVIGGVTLDGDDALDQWAWAVLRTHAAENAWLEAKRSRPGKP